MKFKLDENMPSEIAADLRAFGHEADTAADEGLTGAEDHDLLSRIRAEDRIIPTMDKGMADIRLQHPSDCAGIILFRPRSTGRKSVLTFVRQHLPAILLADLKGRLAVVSDSGIRSR